MPARCSRRPRTGRTGSLGGWSDDVIKAFWTNAAAAIHVISPSIIYNRLDNFADAQRRNITEAMRAFLDARGLHHLSLDRFLVHSSGIGGYPMDALWKLVILSELRIGQASTVEPARFGPAELGSLQ